MSQTGEIRGDRVRNKITISRGSSTSDNTLTSMEYDMHFWLLFIKWHRLKEKSIYDEAMRFIHYIQKKIERLSVLLSLEFSAFIQYKFSVIVGTMF